MKYFLIIVLAIFTCSFVTNPDCGDGNVYASMKQTEYDKRFDDYPKIDAVPEYKDGDKKLTKLIQSELELSDVAKSQIFNLNYQFTVTCEGKIKNVKQIGDPKADDWTNIIEIIQATEGDWIPAKIEGHPVDCIYFGKIFINGMKY